MSTALAEERWWHTYADEGGGPGVGIILQVYLEHHAAVVLGVGLQQWLQDDAACGLAPGMQIADQNLHVVNVSACVLSETKQVCLLGARVK